ncbi:MAG: polysaccharide pyruvyl transferase family protein [bacterium]
MGTKHVLISGYYGMGNAGDELILASILTDMRTCIPGASIMVLSGSPAQTARDFAVHAVNRKNPWGVLTALIKADLVMTGGGGIFQDTTSSLSLYYYAAIIFCAYLLRKTNCVYAVEISNLKHRFNRMIVKNICRLARYMSVRNLESSAHLKEWGYAGNPLILPDPVLGLCGLQKHVQQEAEAVHVGFVIRQVHRRSKIFRQTYLQRLGKIIQYCIDCRILPVLVPFHKKQDIAICVQLEKIVNKKLLILCFNSVAELLNVFAEFSLVISSRLHALILAHAYHIPSIGFIPADNDDGGKIKNFLEFSENKNYFLEESLDPDAVIARIDSVLHKTPAENILVSTAYLNSLFKTKEIFWKQITAFDPHK